jgi:hypothetical protein
VVLAFELYDERSLNCNMRNVFQTFTGLRSDSQKAWKFLVVHFCCMCCHMSPEARHWQ